MFTKTLAVAQILMLWNSRGRFYQIIENNFDYSFVAGHIFPDSEYEWLSSSFAQSRFNQIYRCSQKTWLKRYSRVIPSFISRYSGYLLSRNNWLIEPSFHPPRQAIVLSNVAIFVGGPSTAKECSAIFYGSESLARNLGWHH